MWKRIAFGSFQDTFKFEAIKVWAPRNYAHIYIDYLPLSLLHWTTNWLVIEHISWENQVFKAYCMSDCINDDFQQLALVFVCTHHL